MEKDLEGLLRQRDQEIQELRAMRTEMSIDLMQEFMLRKKITIENDELRDLVRRLTASVEHCKMSHGRKVYEGVP